MRHFVTIEFPTRTKNELGEQEIGWVTLDQAWAKVHPLSGREQMYAKQAQSKVTHKIQMRWFSGFTSDCRIQWTDDDNTVHIAGIQSLIDVEQRHIEWEASCIEQILPQTRVSVVSVTIIDSTTLGVAFAGATIASLSSAPRNEFQISDADGAAVPTGANIVDGVLQFDFGRSLAPPITWTITDATQYAFTPSALFVGALSGTVS
jgi:SPP1 family predicted phage head-tail adaptor